MKIAIPLTKSKTNFLDLRYALRSVEKFTNATGIILIGEKPNWVQNVEHIAATDDPKKEWKERNIFHKAWKVFETEEKFLFANDDHFFLSETDIENYPYYYKNTCYQSMLHNNSSYRGTMNHTLKWLSAKGFEDKNFDGHCPIVFEHRRFLETVVSAPWNAQKFGFGMKSLYCAGMEGEFMEDKKIHVKLSRTEAKAICTGRSIISCTDAAIKTGLGEYFAEELFKEKSKYER